MELTKKNIDRRKFLKLTGASGAMLVLGFTTANAENQPEVFKITDEGVFGAELNPFIVIDKTGKITLINHKPEMGQGVFQSMPMLIAEELEVDMDKVDVVQGQGNRRYGDQMVGGSNSVRGQWEPLRKVGASAREMLIMAAANKWGTKPEKCHAEDGKVFDKKGKKSFTYGELVEDAAQLKVPENPKLKEPHEFKILGKPLPRKDTPVKVSGEAQFGLDVEVPGMLYASVERSPAIHGKIESYDEAAAKAVSGVKHVVKAERLVYDHVFEGVAVVADSYWAALQGRKALNVQWDLSGYEDIDSRKIESDQKALKEKDGFLHESEGDFDTAFTNAAKIIEADYSLPYLSHTPMEPMNMTAHVTDNNCEIWGATQSPQGAVGSLVKYLGIPEENIKIHVTFLGGGFGRRAFHDFLIEAASISKAVKAPVKVVWTREDDTQQGPFRPGTFHHLRAGFDTDGKPVALQHKMIGQALAYQSANADKTKMPWGVMEAINLHYKFPNWKTNYVSYENQIPVLWWRSVYSSTNAFAHECFIDEVAHEAGKDPLQFRKEMLAEEPRYVKVLERLEKESGWHESLEEGMGKGVAIAECFGSICGQVAYVKRVDGKLNLDKVVAVIDCGMTVNPDTIVAQTEGNIVMALTAAVKDPILFKRGRAIQSNFHNYNMIRINEMPAIEVYIMENTEKPGGVGEPGLPPLAPALANAVFSESGQRIRSLPFRLERA